jgi:type IV pilus assembly protein PilN
VIRINLIGTARAKTKKRAAFGTPQKMIVACSLILVLTAAFVGWRYWSLSRTSARLNADITEAQQETTRLHSVIQQVQQFELRKTQLQQRVILIEQLRKGQTGPVQMLDQISRALPPALWLTGLRQTATDILIDGNCTGLTTLSDFVKNLESSGYFARPIEIISTTADLQQQQYADLTKFSIKAQYRPAGDGNLVAPAPVAAAKVGG